MRADEVRRAQPGGSVVTYLRVYQVSEADLGGALSADAAVEVRLYHTPISLEEAIAQVQSLTRLAAPRRAVAYSLAHIEQRAAGGWGSLPAVLQKLVAAGLADFAEVPVDLLADLPRSLQHTAEAGLRLTRLTVSNPVGSRQLELLATVRTGLEQLPSVIRFAPLPRVAPADKPTTGYDDVRMVALSRLALSDAQIRRPVSIEVDWSLYGPKLAQVALTFGADHLDAVPATSDPALGPRRATVEDVERNIRAAGFEPQEYRY